MVNAVTKKEAIAVCVDCKKFNGLKKDGFPKACKLKRTMGIIQCSNRHWLKYGK